jgi:hypothetical protein
MEKEKTIKLESYFGEKDFTLKQFQQRWSSPVNEVWAFLIDHGSVEEMKFGKRLAEEIFPKVTSKAFDKFYEEQNNEV